MLQKNPLHYDFANILFAGPCNRFCPWCIGKQLPSEVNVNNLDRFPPTNLESFISAVNQHAIQQIVFTGTVTDPQLYKHEMRLLDYLRIRLHDDTTYSLHTNGVMALKKIDSFNYYDKVCISFPSFIPATYKKLMGAGVVPHLEQIIETATIPIKISCIINEHNYSEMQTFLQRCIRLGIKRIVLRKLLGDTRNWNPLRNLTPNSYYRNNPVYKLDNTEVTYWDFNTSESTSINLFPNGVLGTDYLLTHTQEFLPAVAY